LGFSKLYHFAGRCASSGFDSDSKIKVMEENRAPVVALPKNKSLKEHYHNNTPKTKASATSEIKIP